MVQGFARNLRVSVCVPVKALANKDTLLPTQMFPRLPMSRNLLCPQQIFPSLRSPRNIMGNNVSATKCPRLPGP